MTLEELKDKWRTWVNVCIKLEISQSSTTYWRKRGSIPYSSQLMIQDKTKGALKAKKEDDLKLLKRND